MESKKKQKKQKKILNENQEHGNMLKTITEEPVMKEGKPE